MARPIEYNLEKVLDRAMNMFWHSGYESTTMKDLSKATGLTPSSMYNLFGSKEGLFRESLLWYYKTILDDSVEKLKHETGLSAVDHFIKSFVNRINADGCFYNNTFVERYNIDKKSLEIVDTHYNNLERLLEEKLLYAKEYEGYLGNPSIRAQQIIVLIQGIRVYTKNNKNETENLLAIFYS